MRLLGDPSKARQRLGWQHKISFDQLVKEMVESRFGRVRREGAHRNVQD